MDQNQIQIQTLNLKLDNLEKRLILLENRKVYENQTTLNLIIYDFIINTICISDTKNFIFFDKNLNCYGVYSRFLQFYSLTYSHLNMDFTQESIIKEFSSSLVQMFSYDIKNNIKFTDRPFRDIAYKGLEFKNLRPFEATDINAEAIVEAFIESEIEISLESKMIVFDKKFRVNGIFPKFLSFYFLNYSHVFIDLRPKNILRCFSNGLITKLSYEKNCIVMKTLENDFVFKDLQFKFI